MGADINLPICHGRQCEFDRRARIVAPQVLAAVIQFLGHVRGVVGVKDGRPAAAMYALVPALVFWILDAYYLALEFRYRELYKGVIKSTSPSYDLETTPVDVRLMAHALFRPSVFLIHVSVLGVIWCVTK